MNGKKKSLYIETTIPSYATAKDSRDVLKLGKQIVTRAFWKDERHKFDLCTSEVVLDECGCGDPDAVRRRLEFLAGIKELPITDEVNTLAEIYQKLLGIPDRAKVDCVHLAVCVTYHVDILLTWNCAHLGWMVQNQAVKYNEKYGFWTPALATPDNIFAEVREQS
ncbi:MAG: type II toxin-antitoxin system VapC family toxin [Treponema sp.]|jgi:predicted nucleic acid-binding protein|nr:type II toxin-antitoxin system VapC family toxin [Treponema sp.]